MKISFAFLTLVLFSVSVSAQMGMSQRGGTGINAVDRQHDMQGAPKAATPEEQLNSTMTKLTTDLSLNGLQEAAIRMILKDQMSQIVALRADKTRPDSDKQGDARLLTEKSDKEIQALLDPDQIIKYQSLKEEMRSGKKKKKKNKKDEEEVHE